MIDSQPQEQQSHICCVTALQKPHNKELGVEAECCLDAKERDAIVKFAQCKLKLVHEVCGTHALGIFVSRVGHAAPHHICFSFFVTDKFHFAFFLSHWCIKGPKGIVCMVIASKVFPEEMAMECMDEFSEAQEKESKKFLGIQKLLA